MSISLYTLTTLSDTVRHWRFQGNLQDISGNNNHLTANSFDASNYTSDGYTEPDTTVYTKTIGDGSYTSLVYAAAADFLMGMSDFTIEIIFKTMAEPQILFFGTSALPIVGGGFFAGISGDVFRCAIEDTSANEANVSSGHNGMSIIINDGEWHYCALVVNRADDEMSAYIDGVQDGTIVNISSVTGGINATAGSLFRMSISNVDQKLDEMCITKRALSAAEILTRSEVHGDSTAFEYSGSAATIVNTVNTNLSAFDIQLKHACDHQLSSGQFTLEECPRCLGSGYYYDIRFDESGRPSLLSIEDKLIQSLEKMVLTSTNKFHEDVFVDLKGRIGSLATDVETIVKYDLQQAVAALKQNQRSVPNLSSRAQIKTLDSIEVVKESPTSYNYLVEITTVSGETLELTGTVNLVS